MSCGLTSDSPLKFSLLEENTRRIFSEVASPGQTLESLPGKAGGLPSSNYEALAADTVDKLYAYDEGTVLFKPTKASDEQFRLSEAEAVSYFVTGIVPEDHGFAIQPWSAVRFENAGVILDCNSAIVMGNYYFTDTDTGEEAKAEFTFGYRRDVTGDLLINLHHSSFPHIATN